MPDCTKELCLRKKPIVLFIGTVMLLAADSRQALSENQQNECVPEFSEVDRIYVSKEWVSGQFSMQGDSGKKVRKVNAAFRHCTFEPGALSLMARRREISSLLLVDCKIGAQLLQEIAPMVNLKGLSIVNVPLFDEDFSFLRSLDQLRTLSVDKTGVKGNYLAYLKCPEKIETISAEGTCFDDQHLLGLRRCTRLSYLNLKNTKVSGRGFLSMNWHPPLRDLTVDLNNGATEWLIFSSDLPELQRLGPNTHETYMVNCKISENLPLMLKKNIYCITRLNLDGSEIPSKALPGLRQLPNLTELSMGDCSVSGVGIGALRNLRYLRSLRLEDDPLTERGLSEVLSIKRLQELDLSRSLSGAVDKDRLSRLANSRLETLLLNGNRLYRSDFKHLSRMKTLDKLYLSRIEVAPWMINELVKVKSLRTLGIGDCIGVDTPFLKRLPLFKQLKELTVRGTNINERDELWLKESMPGCNIVGNFDGI